MESACHAVGLMCHCSKDRHTSYLQPVRVLGEDDRVVEGNGQEDPIIHLPPASGAACARVHTVHRGWTAILHWFGRSPSTIPHLLQPSDPARRFFTLFYNRVGCVQDPLRSICDLDVQLTGTSSNPFGSNLGSIREIPNQGYGSVRVQISGSNPRNCRRLGSTIQFPRPLRRRRTPWRARKCGNTTPNACCESR